MALRHDARDELDALVPSIFDTDPPGRGPRRGIAGEAAGPCWHSYGLQIERCGVLGNCPPCLSVRSRAVERVGRSFQSLGVAVHRAITENA